MTSLAFSASRALFDAEPQSSSLDCLLAAVDGNFNLRTSDSDELGRTINRLMEKLSGLARSSLDHVVESSISINETSVKSAHLLHGLRSVDDHSQAIAAAAEEMAATVSEIGRAGQSIVDETRDASGAVRHGVEMLGGARNQMGVITRAVSDTSERIGDLQALANRISMIADGIKKIAAQTNLLAINAAVEAARAGDAGRGFAVVAAEVKALSDRTSSATTEIAGIIQNLHGGMDRMIASMADSSTAVSEGANAVNGLGEAMGAIEARINRVVDHADHISEALGQQNAAAVDVASGVARLAAHAAKSTQALEGIIDTMDTAQKAVFDQLQQIAELDIPGKIVRLAQSDHVIWKRRLANMIVGREGLRPQELADHHSCRLGKWYDKVDDPAIKANPAFSALAGPHRDVHAHGIEAVRRYNSGDIQGALDCINAVEAASSHVLHCLKRMER